MLFSFFDGWVLGVSYRYTTTVIIFITLILSMFERPCTCSAHGSELRIDYIMAVTKLVQTLCATTYCLVHRDGTNVGKVKSHLHGLTIDWPLEISIY